MFTQSEEKLRFHLENTPLGFIEWDAQLHIKTLSRKAQEIFGCTLAEFNDHSEKGFSQVYAEDRELVKKIWNELLSGKVTRNTVQHRNITSDGRIIWCEWFNSVLKDKDGKVTSILSLVQDITERREANEKSKQLTHLYAFISQVNKDIVHVKDEPTLFQNACTIATELGHFKMAWIGLFDEDHSKITLASGSGLSNKDMLHFAETSFKINGPIDQVLQTGSYYTCRDIGNDQHFDKALIEKNSIHSCMILPVKKSGVIIGTFNLYTSEYGFTDEREIELLSGLSNDISSALERFAKADNLVQSEKRLNEAQAIAHVGSWHLVFATKESLWSEEACRIYGLNAGDNTQTYASWVSFIHPDDMKNVLEILSESQVTFNDTLIHHRIVLKDGTIKQVISRGRYEFDQKGNATGLYGITHDVTEETAAQSRIMESEKRYRQIVQTAQEGIWLIDELNNTVFVNRRFSEMFGYTSEEMVGKSVFELMDAEQKKISVEKLERRKKGIAEDFELMYLSKSGQKVWANVSASPILDSDGEYIGALSMLTDITSRKTAEIEKDRMTLELHRSREKEQLAVTDAVITGEENARQEMGRELHDNINQVLATAQLYLGMTLKKDPEGNPLIRKTEELITAAIKEIRDLSHATISPFIEDDSLLEALENLSLITERSGSVKIARSFPCFDEKTIPEKLKLTIYRIVQEQYQNILKYAKAENVILQLKREKNIISLLISDDGVGFDTTQKASGIGMKNIKTRISIFEGAMSVVSSPGNGCSLWVSIYAPS